MLPKYYFVLRFDKDGNSIGTIDIPERDLQETLKRHKNWKVVGDTSYIATKDPVISKGIECPICGAKFTSEIGLKTHKGHMHK